ncbi:unnamed protein product [Mycena citricolor]|uniref:Uncharacterized protein n=1 Tax=Mycena citricolor TaxID=2018698 RepID=A0AAD2K7P1_9AGAR|nr:unnamed protein product [Mycena citricolor]
MLKASVKRQKDEILACLAKNQPVSDVDNHFIDQEANLVNEDVLLSKLEAAPDYDKAFDALDEKEKLEGLTNGALKMLTKQKCTEKQKLPQNKAVAASEPALVFTKKENATLSQKIQTLNWHYTEILRVHSQCVEDVRALGWTEHQYHNSQ